MTKEEENLKATYGLTDKEYEKLKKVYLANFAGSGYGGNFETFLSVVVSHRKIQTFGVVV